jgi:DNA-binding transcriptional ArsR family regulator
MVNNQERQLDFILYALSDSTRRSMLAQLAKKEASVTELAAPHDMSLAAISKHLKILAKAKFVEKTKEGRSFRCRANLKPLDPIFGLLEELGHFWRDQLDALDQFLSTHDLEENKLHGIRRKEDNAVKSRRKKNYPR